MDRLPLSRDRHGQLQMAGTGPVSLHVDYSDVLGKGGHGAVFSGQIIDLRDGTMLRVVAFKTNASEGETQVHQLEQEATMHIQAWMHLDNVLEPLGLLAAHDPTGTPAGLVLELGVPLATLLSEAGPLHHRSCNHTKAIARIVFQLLRFIVAGDYINMMHRGMKMKNMYVRHAENLDRAELAVSNFGGAQRGEETADGSVVYRAGVNTWSYTSPRMAAIVYNGMAGRSNRLEDVEIDQQASLYNELFGWARIASMALMRRPPPDILYGPCDQDYDQIPEEGHGDVPNAVHHILYFALDLLTAGRIDTQVDREYIHGLDWYGRILEILAHSTAASTEQENTDYLPHYEDDYAEAVMVFYME